MTVKRLRWVVVVALCAAAMAPEFAQSGPSMPQLASALIAPYRGGDRIDYLDELFRLQIVAERYSDAVTTIASLRALRGGATPQLRADDIPYEMYAKAKARSIADRVPFATAYARTFRETFARVDDLTSALVVRALVLTEPAAPLASLRGAPLIRAYLLAETFRAIAQPDVALIGADDRRRYVIAADLLVKTPDGAKICVTVARPRSASTRLPALLNFTIYADRRTTLAEARRTASNGYAGVEGLTRGKGCSPDNPVPYEHDGSDADAVINWIARQPWSDGRVGMYGGSYEGFTQWAAAKHRPHALQALMPSVTNAPGIDSPMEGNVFQSDFYNWPLYVTAGKWLNANDEGDPAGLNALEAKWYVAGVSYRSMGELGGPPNPIWQRWLEHPGYDAYWQHMIPYGQDFAHIGIPVLTTTGYFDGGQIGALYYFNQYYAHDPKAQSYLVIGPYDHVRGQRGTTSVLGDDVNEIFGYRLDPVAHIDLGELRYAWFNYIFKGAPRPAILQNRVNYEVMGANAWRHVPTLAAMSARRIRFYVSDVPAGSFLMLADKAPRRGVVISQTLDLADRSDVNRTPPPGNGLDTYQAVAFASPPFVKPFELSGFFSGHLDYATNKRDFDFEISLYDRTKDGAYVPLGLYYYMMRASYAGDRTRRSLLVPGRRTRLDFTSGRLTSRAFAAGSRLVVLINLLKEPDMQIDYGTGKDVGDETLADATSPLRVQWFGDSYVDVPASK